MTLGQFEGKVVVLEWNNPGCPYVRKHYGSGNMQKTQAAARKDGAAGDGVLSSRSHKAIG